MSVVLFLCGGFEGGLGVGVESMRVCGKGVWGMRGDKFLEWKIC